MKSLLGQTFESTLPSAPSPSLAGREKFGAIVMGGDNNPGPGAHNVNSRAHGKQVLSQNDSQPSYTFCTGAARSAPKQTHRVGPDAYKIPGSVGKQVMSTTRNIDSVRFSKARQRPHLGSFNPTGPGEYSVGSTIGRQELSTSQTAPMAKFGTSQRPAPYQTSATMRASMGEPSSSMGKQARNGVRTAASASLSGRERFGSTIPNHVGPGPAAYASPSSIGTQLSSESRSNPSVGFGTAARNSTRAQATAPGPGAYALKTLLGPAVASYPSSPACAMAGREKFGSAVDNKDAAKTPGPGTYATQNGPVPHFRNQPKHSLGGKWSDMMDRSTTPAPDAYKSQSGFGKQLSSRKRTTATQAFGKGRARPMPSKGANQVGPGEYAAPSSVGRQNLSTRSTAAAGRFGTEIQRPDMGGRGASRKSPGPGKYMMPSSIGRMANSMKPSAPSSGLSGRTKFGSFM